MVSREGSYEMLVGGCSYGRVIVVALLRLRPRRISGDGCLSLGLAGLEMQLVGCFAWTVPPTEISLIIIFV
jgi:hypothetical protein